MDPMGNYLNDHPTSYRNLRHVYTTFTWLFHAISNQLDQLHPRQPQKNRLLPRCTLKGIFVMMLLGWTATARCAELKPGNTCDARWLYTVSTPSCRKSRHKKKWYPWIAPLKNAVCCWSLPHLSKLNRSSVTDQVTLHVLVLIMMYYQFFFSE